MSNKSYSISLALALWAVGCAGVLRGEDFLSLPVDVTAPTPNSQFLKKPDAIAYTTTFTYKDGAAATTPDQQEKLDAMKKANPRIKAIEVDKFGDIRHDVQQWDAGDSAQIDLWYSQTAVFKEGTNALGEPNGIHSEPAFAKGAEAFPELSWVGKNTFVGAIQQGKRVINVYRRKFSGNDVGGYNPIFFQNEEATAYIDDASHLPLAVQTPRFVVQYTYRNAPTNLDPPAKYQEAIQKYRNKKAHPFKTP